MADGLQLPTMRKDSFLTSDEAILLAELNPKFLSNAQMMRAGIQQNVNADVMKQIALGIQDVPGVIPKQKGNLPSINGEFASVKKSSKESTSTSGKGPNPPNGGFLEFLIPFIPKIVELGAKGIKWVIDKARGRGAIGEGVFVPNLRYMKGSGKMNIKQYIADNMDRYRDISSKVKDLRGAKFWNHVLGFAQDEIRNIAIENGISPNAADQVASSTLAKIVPQSFTKNVEARASAEKETSGKGAETQASSVMKPVLRWSLEKVLEGKLPEQSKGLIDAALEKYKVKYPNGSGLIGGNRFFDKIKEFVKKVAPGILTKIANIGLEKAIPIIQDLMGKWRTGDSEFSPSVFGSNESDTAGKGRLGGVDLTKFIKYGKPKMRGNGASEDMKQKMARLRAMRGKKKATRGKGKKGDKVSTDGFQIKLL